MSKNKRNAVSAGVGYTVGNYLIKGLTFITIPIFSRLLSTSEYGLYNTFVTYEAILCIFINFAIHSSYRNARYRYRLANEGARKGKDYYSYVSETVLFSLLSLIFWLILINMCNHIASRIFNLDTLSLNLLVIYSGGVGLINCFNADVGLEYSYKKFLAVSGFNAVGNIALSLLFVLKLFRDNKFLGYVLGTVIPIVIVSIYIIFYFLKRSKTSKNIKMLIWGIKYSLPIIPHGLSQVILNQFDRIMISRMVSSTATGIYSFAYNIYSIVAVTFMSLDNVWSPWFYEKMQAKQYQKIKKYSSIYIITMFIFSACIILICPEIIKILGSENYWNAMYCAIPIVAGGFFSFLYTIPASVEYYREKTNFIAIATSIAAVFNIILNYFFINHYGYVAAAYTTLVTYFLYFLFHFFLAKKIEGRNLFSNKIILGCSMGIICIMFFANITIHLLVLRWLVAIMILGFSVWYEEKKFNFLFKLKSK